MDGEKMAISGNKGEWSEAYALLKLLAEGKLFAADEELNRISDMFFPIIKIIREETIGKLYEYRPNISGAKVEIYHNGVQVLCLPSAVFADEADSLFAYINSCDSKRGTFEVAETEAFIRKIYMNKLKAPSSDKSDINIQIRDVNTGYENIVGFSIKSELGSPSTLLNASKSTNFIFKVKGLDKTYISQINNIETRSKIKDRIKTIVQQGGNFIFSEMANDTFNENLIMIDSQMPVIVANMLIGYYSEAGTNVSKLTSYVSEVNPLLRDSTFYKYKVKEMLCAIALGMTPATKWDGTDEATGGYIVVKASGDVLAYHIYNRDYFKEYLFNNTKFESASSTRHDYGKLYLQDEEVFIKLNLQIRFL